MTNRTKRLVVILATVALVQGLAAQGQAPLAKVAEMAKQATKEMGSPGLSAAIVVNDRLVWEDGFGTADVENQVPVQADTVFRIASISKTLAATAVMQLVEQGRVSLDDPIQKYVPAFPDKGVTITVRHVLSHTSGIRHYKPGEMASVVNYGSVAEAIGIFKDDPLLFTPGNRYSYSSYAFNLLAGVVEARSGLTYEAYLHEHVFGPAGMKSTRLEHPQEVVPHRARQYVRNGSDVENAPYADLSVKWAGGGVISTAGDLVRFHIALDQGTLLKPSTLAEMYAPATLNDGTRSQYGLGWFVETDKQHRTWIYHSGGATGGSSFLLRQPEGKFAVALLSNVEGVGGRLRALAQRMAEVMIGPAAR